jgi:uncharacterized protein YggL (DUF469 family)
LRESVASLPDFEVEQLVLYQPLLVSARNFSCSNVEFDDFKFSYDLFQEKDDSSPSLFPRIEVDNLSLQCFLEFEWAYVFLNGGAQGNIDFNGNISSILMSFENDTPILSHESNTSEFCNASIAANNMVFEGNILADVFDVLQSLLRTEMETQVTETVCAALSSFDHQYMLTTMDGSNPWNMTWTVVYSSEPMKSNKSSTP